MDKFWKGNLGNMGETMGIFDETILYLQTIQTDSMI